MRKLLGGGPRRSLLAIALVAAASGVTLMVPAAPAAAQSEPVNSCGPNISEYDPHPAGIYEEFNPEGRGWATLRYDPIAGGYEHVFYASGGGLRAGDRVSLDWWDGGAVYHPCHARVPSGYTTTHTKGVNGVPGRSFRVCLHNGEWHCSKTWWTIA
jgi:hypothetical protein